MKILSIDTASDICGISILEDNHLICQLDENTGKTHSENLMPMLDRAFKQTNLTLKDIDLLVCDKGPGSFTGIRIGIATVKAFHDSLGIPCTSVSSLEAFAYSIDQDGLIASMIDCKNNNCYFALYERKNSEYFEILAPTAITIEEAMDFCQEKISSSSPITFVGDGIASYKELISQKWKENIILAKPIQNQLNSYSLGLAGYDKFKKNALEEVLPSYLKKPQAQRQLEEKSKNIEISSMTQEDLKQIASLPFSDFDDFWTYSILQDELKSENSYYLVAKSNDEIVGFAGIKLLADKADIMNIAVKKSFRNQGIGSLLLKNVMQLSQEKKLTSIFLEVMEENYPAIHLYKKFGFKQVGIRKNYYQGKNGLLMSY